ncbi:hypothetical protein DQ04_06141050 [Trypanosoma grayi]|uniref:hypothetical protein n=1 Tax=Trypanosoma grayi TaxID=71804 RepID=UPI0004F4AB84|nr:hypothetical protein DQ04_06141050 [Trypanosoma grayi]KEG08942.1 hypothetical protein DQ04_06141050 [Trypanosoma grayi]
MRNSAHTTGTAAARLLNTLPLSDIHNEPPTPPNPNNQELKQFPPLESTPPQSPRGVSAPSRHCDGAAERQQETKTTGVNSPHEPSPLQRRLLHRLLLNPAAGANACPLPTITHT